MAQEDLHRAWQPAEDTPWLGEVLLGAAGAVHGELPSRRLRAPGGVRRPLPTSPLIFDPEPHELTALLNPSALAARDRLGWDVADRAVVILVDGLGFLNLMARATLAPFLTGEFHAREGRSTIPSTTAANITFLGTGVQPGQTAMAGYTVRNPDTGGAMNLISWAGAPDPIEWQRVPTVFERLEHAHAPGSHVSTWRFERSGLTQAALRGAEYVSGETLAQRVDATLDAVAHGAAGLTYLYWADVDAVGHLHGWQTAAWEEELAHLDTEVQRLVRGLPRGTLVVVTADHGMIDVPLGDSEVFGGPARIDISAHDDLARDVDLVAGENRFLHLYTRRPEEVARRWTRHLGERAIVRTRAQAIGDDLFGPVRADVFDIIGDVTVAMLGDISVADTRVVSAGMFNLKGLHGSVTQWERSVPVLSLVTG